MEVYRVQVVYPESSGKIWHLNTTLELVLYNTLDCILVFMSTKDWSYNSS